MCSCHAATQSGSNTGGKGDVSCLHSGTEQQGQSDKEHEAVSDDSLLPPEPQVTPAASVPATSYLIIANKNSDIIRSFLDYKEACRFLTLLRRAGADVSLFKELQA
jgi:hypothetical protein